MKIFQVCLLILLSTYVFSQETNKYKIANSIIDVKEIIKTDLGLEVFKEIEAMNLSNSKYSVGILELDNILDGNEQKLGKLLGGCQCHMMMGKLEIANAIGFMAGIASVIEINISDSTFKSTLSYNTDGMQTYKFNKEGEFITDIVVALERAKLEFSPDSKFEHDGILKGKLIGTSIKYYEKDNSSLGYKEIQTNVLSIFECKLTDYEKILKDNGKGDLLEEMKEDLEHQKKKKN